MKEVFMLEIMFTTSNLIKAHDKGGFTKKKNPLRYYINYIYLLIIFISLQKSIKNLICLVLLSD